MPDRESARTTRGLRVIVCGGRNYSDEEAVARALLNVWLDHDRPPMQVVQGGAKGADEAARKVAETQGFRCDTFHADWSIGPYAGPKRNQQMVEAGADLLIAFPGGKGTADCVLRAERAGIPVRREAARV